MPPSESIIILACDKASYTEQCLRSLLSASPIRFEVIVVDNGSTDHTPQLLRDMAPAFDAAGASLRVIRNQTNLGACRGRNQGLAAAQGRYLVFLDNDCVISDPNWIETLRAAIEAQPRPALAGPKICYPFEPHDIQCAGVGISPSGRVQFRGRGEPRSDPRFNQRRQVQALISACLMFPREIYEAIGGLDEAYSPVQFEDFDFCYRAKAAGYLVLYVPEAEVYHWESVTSGGTAALPNTYLIIKNGLRFKKTWRHVFEKEHGPPDAECSWRVITAPGLDGQARRLGAR